MLEQILNRRNSSCSGATAGSGHRILLRRNRHRPRRRLHHDPHASARRAGSAQPGRDALPPTVASFPNWPRATTSAASCRCCARCWQRPDAEASSVDLVAYTRGPGACGCAARRRRRRALRSAAAIGKPALGVHHLEGHLLSPFLSADPPQFPFVALLVSGGHTQLLAGGRRRPLRVARRHDRRRRGRGLRQVCQAARASAIRADRPSRGWPSSAIRVAFALPRPLLQRDSLDFSFAGLKTAVRTQAMKLDGQTCEQARADLAASTQEAIVDVLVRKSMAALERTGPAAAGRGRRSRRQCAAALAPRG